MLALVFFDLFETFALRCIVAKCVVLDKDKRANQKIDKGDCSGHTHHTAAPRAANDDEIRGSCGQKATARRPSSRRPHSWAALDREECKMEGGRKHKGGGRKKKEECVREEWREDGLSEPRLSSAQPSRSSATTRRGPEGRGGERASASA